MCTQNVHNIWTDRQQQPREPLSHYDRQTRGRGFCLGQLGTLRTASPIRSYICAVSVCSCITWCLLVYGMKYSAQMATDKAAASRGASNKLTKNCVQCLACKFARVFNLKHTNNTDREQPSVYRRIQGNQRVKDGDSVHYISTGLLVTHDARKTFASYTRCTCIALASMMMLVAVAHTTHTEQKRYKLDYKKEPHNLLRQTLPNTIYSTLYLYSIRYSYS